MTAESTPAWNVFKQIFAEHWAGFKRLYPRYDQRYYDSLVDKMLGCGNPDQMGYLEYRCLHCGEGTHRVEHSPLAVGRRAVFDAVEQKFGGSRTA